MKKICIVTKNMMSGGTERVVAQLLDFIMEQGLESALILHDDRDIHYSIPDKCKLVIIGRKAKNPLLDKFMRFKAIRHYVKKLHPDIVLTLPEEIGIYTTLFLLGTGIPVVVSERNNPWVMPNKKITRLLRRFAYPFVDGLIFQTRQAASFFPVSQQKKGIVLPNPLDLSRLPQSFSGIREKTIVSGGRLEDQKNFPLLIRAFARFLQTHPDYRLVIYGEGKRRTQMEELAAQLLPEGSWSLPGRVDDLPQRISHSRIFALSSDYEGIPNVLIEALAVGTPCISTDCAPGGAAELIQHEINGLLVPVGDEEALAQGLCRLADDSKMAITMAKCGSDIRQKLDSKKVARQWLNYLDKCVEK